MCRLRLGLQRVLRFRRWLSRALSDRTNDLSMIIFNGFHLYNKVKLSLLFGLFSCLWVVHRYEQLRLKKTVPTV